ncbi:putative caffeine synthase 2 [Hordeum vulgare]|nr:putative caffeine synthase 2 [Hordeum vulgare]
MDRVEGLMQDMKLSERRGRKILWSGGGKVGAVEPQAIAKLLSDKPTMAEPLAGALVRVWCPLKGLECKDLGTMFFSSLFTKRSGRGRQLRMGHGNLGSRCWLWRIMCQQKL